MDIYSQNNEQEIVANYFKGREGLTLLDIGANDGVTFSNSRHLLLNGWSGLLLEPSINAFKRLSELYKDNQDILCLNIGISEKNEVCNFWESGSHIGNDVGLLSCIDEEEKKRWGDTAEFHLIESEFITFEEIKQLYFLNEFNFITIDAEGYDFKILQQIDLNKVGCECLCIEHNDNAELKLLYAKYCIDFGLKEYSS